MNKCTIDIPRSFLEEEERDGYLVKSAMKRVWATELDLLSQLNTICTKHGLRYFATGGTLLGAVRHGGFIPWDDDLDIAMPRADYDQLCSVASDELHYPYFFQTTKTDEGYFRGHAQLRNSATTGILKSELPRKLPFNQGIFIDIIPLDYISDDIEQRRRQEAQAKRIRRRAIGLQRHTLCYKNVNHEIKKTISHPFWILLGKVTSYKKDFEKLEAVCKSYSNKHTSTLSFVSFQPGVSRWYCSEDECQSLAFLDFEFTTIPVPTHYDAILKRMYGDYMNPIKGGMLHGETILDASLSYSEWMKAFFSKDDCDYHAVSPYTIA